MSVEIETGVPMPTLTRGLALPFADMATGDSFALDVTEGGKVGLLAAKVRSRAAMYAKAHGGHFVVRIVMEDDIERVRCWKDK